MLEEHEINFDSFENYFLIRENENIIQVNEKLVQEIDKMDRQAINLLITARQVLDNNMRYLEESLNISKKLPDKTE